MQHEYIMSLRVHRMLLNHLLTTNLIIQRLYFESTRVLESLVELEFWWSNIDDLMIF